MKKLMDTVVPADWVLFEKDQINKLLIEYAEGTLRLR